MVSSVPIQEAAKAVAASRFFRDISTPDQALVILMLAEELDINRFDACRGLRVIEGQLTMMTALISSKIKRSELYDYKIVTQTAEKCSIEFINAETGEVLGAAEFTIEDAKRAGLVREKSGWQKYPSDMLFARALTRGARRYCPDLFGGAVYTPEELGSPDWNAGPEEPKPQSTEGRGRTRPETAHPTSSGQAAQDGEPEDASAKTRREIGDAIGAAMEAQMSAKQEATPAAEASQAPVAEAASAPPAAAPALGPLAEKAAAFVARYREKNYADQRILLVASTQGKYMRDAVEALLRGGASPAPQSEAPAQPAAAPSTSSGQAMGEGALVEPPAEPTGVPAHIAELLALCERYNLGAQNKERWLSHFRVARIEDLTPEQAGAITRQAEKVYGKKGAE